MKKKRMLLLFALIFGMMFFILSSVSGQEELPVTVQDEVKCEWIITLNVTGLEADSVVLNDTIVDETPCGNYVASEGWRNWQVGETNEDGEFTIAVIHHGWGTYVYTFRTEETQVTIAFSYDRDGVFIHNAAQTEMFEDSCSGALPPTLFAGDTGRVTYTDGSPTSIRVSPQGRIIHRLAEGTEFEVLGSLLCTEGRQGNLWWVQASYDGDVGWMPFGYEGEEYWIEPVP